MCELSLCNIKVSKKEFIVEAKMLFALAIQRYLKANMLECYGHSDGGREEGGGESWRFGGRKKISYIIRGLE